MNGKTPTDMFCPSLRLLSVVVIFEIVFQFSFCLSFLQDLLNTVVNEDSKIVVKYSSERSINLSVLNSKKVAFVMHESLKVASNLFTIRRCFKLYSSLLRCTSYFSLTGTNQLCLRVTAWISYRAVSQTRLVFFPEAREICITLFFKPKLDLISTIIVFGFLEIQSKNVPVDDKPYQDAF